MNKTILALLACAALAGVFISVTSLNNKQQEVIKVQYEQISDDLILLIDPPKEFLKRMEKETLAQEQSGTQQEIFMDSMIYQNLRGACINGKNPDDLTSEQIYQEFLQGPCSPIVIVPGFAGSSLQVMIDCETLKEKQPSIFHGCGWSSCNALLGPKSEYLLWMAKPFTPMSFLEFTKSSSCFGDIIQLVRNESSEPSKRYNSPDGITVTWYGNTPETRDDSNCGVNAISRMGNDFVNKRIICDTKGFVNLITGLEEMGLQGGVSYQAVPYDWRQDLISGETQITIPKSIKALYKQTGKKVVVLGHSYGTLQLLYTLNNFMTQEEKDYMVETYIAAAPPYLGAPSAMRNEMGGNPDIVKHIFGHEFVGMSFKSQIEMLTSNPSNFDLYPKDTYFRFQNTPWMDLIRKRIAYEKDPHSFKPEEVPFSFFPSADQKEAYCGQFNARENGNCWTGLNDLTVDPIVQVQDQKYYSNQTQINDNIMNHVVNGPKIQGMYKESLSAQMDDFVNPGVKTVIFYGTMENTEKSYAYEKDPRIETQGEDGFYFPEVTEKGPGDGVVLSNAAIVPGLKWAWEFDQKMENAKPIRFADYCSFNAQSTPIFDQADSNGKMTFTVNGYNGVSCECKEGSPLKNCHHSCFINDPNFVAFIANMIRTKATSSLLTEENQANMLTADQIDSLHKECPNLKL